MKYVFIILECILLFTSSLSLLPQLWGEKCVGSYEAPFKLIATRLDRDQP